MNITWEVRAKSLADAQFEYIRRQSVQIDSKSCEVDALCFADTNENCTCTHHTQLLQIHQSHQSQHPHKQQQKKQVLKRKIDIEHWPCLLVPHPSERIGKDISNVVKVDSK